MHYTEHPTMEIKHNYTRSTVRCITRLVCESATA